ncbi:hypothetical protein NPIL_222411 [Nephila pilipes]|uniref:Uncharacterized protein n=1 Tax=Nephila pilipes TaxID=299642 RepID=A0A8X6Q4Q3_NEPPI|nr:hypothetical protein NPIL_222411 [Nephila pilipes]
MAAKSSNSTSVLLRRATSLMSPSLSHPDHFLKVAFPFRRKKTFLNYLERSLNIKIQDFVISKPTLLCNYEAAKPKALALDERGIVFSKMRAL